MIPDLVVKATVLLGIAWIAALLLRGRAASTRHAVWAGLTAATLMLPLMVSFAPTIDVPVLPAASSPGPITRITEVPTGPRELSVVVERGDKRDAPVSVRLPDSAAPLQMPSSPLLTPRNALLAAWLLVALALAARILAAHLQARSLLRTCEDPSDRVLRAAAGVAASLGVKTPAMRIAPEGLMPAVIGIRNPAIVLPSEASSWSDERLEAVLLHECAHVRRRDAIMQLVSGLATAAYWWHPLAWVAARQIVRERELACDDVVIASGMAGDTYAGHLLDIARSLKTARQPSLAALAMARPSQLEGRLIALLDTRRRDARPTRALATGLVLGLVGLSAVAPLKLVARAVTESTYDAIQPGTAPASAPGQGQNVSPPPPAPAAPVPPDAAQKTKIDSALYDALVKALKDMDADVRAMAVSALSANTAEYDKLSALIAPLLADANADVRTAVVGSLLRSDATQIGPALVKALEDSDPDVRQMALAGLVRLERKDVIPYLDKALKDASEDVRTVAVLGISTLDHPQKQALLSQAAADTSEDVRALVALALADADGPGVSAVLAKLLRDSSADVRAAAAIGLGSVGDKSTTAALAQALKDQHADVRSAAAIALGHIGDSTSLQALTAAIADIDADVRKAALMAAASLGGDWQAQTSLTSTIAGTIAGTISGTLHGRYGGYRSPEFEVPAEGTGASSDANTVRVNGSVLRAGPYRWRANLTAGELIAEAGGLTPEGTAQGLTVERSVRGRIERIAVGENTVLRKGDTLIVRQLRF